MDPHLHEPPREVAYAGRFGHGGAMSEAVPTTPPADAFGAPRALDHLVLPVSSVARARERYTALGFTVAPTGVHPFGTENCCVFFANGVFLEPLAVRRREDAEAAALAGNTFVRRDGAYRFRRDIEGYSHLVLKTDDAAADDRAYRAAAITGGELVEFERRFADHTGKEARAAFALAFAGDLRAPDAGFFSCEVVDAPSVDRSALERHGNGAVAVVEVVMSEPNPTDFQYFLQDVFDQRRMDDHSFGIEFELGNARASVLTPTGLEAFCGLAGADTTRGLLHQTFVVAVDSLSRTAELLKKNGVETLEVGKRLLVPWAPGQGVPFLFEERT